MFARQLARQSATRSQRLYSSTLKDTTVLEHLVCPISKYPLEYVPEKGILFCRDIRVAYPIRDGIPILVPTEGRIVPEEEHI